jgi:hypothetical protein
MAESHDGWLAGSSEDGEAPAAKGAQGTWLQGL